MKVYLVEVQKVEGGILEPIAIKTKWYEAHSLVVGKIGTITEMIVDEVYLEDLYTCSHWRYELDQVGPAVEDKLNETN